ALFQLISSESPGTVDRLVLTASGGPFRGRSAADPANVTVEEALAHPTWDMGGKITIDSATLMNKGLELIEARHLFGVDYDRIDIVVHPQSIIHALVHLNDGASLAHMGYPDMRVPISYALHYPERADVPVRTLDLAELGQLTFEPPDVEAFPCLRLAREAAVAGGTAPCVLNAANEVAVEAFLDGELSFLGIAEVIERALDELPAEPLRLKKKIGETEYAIGSLPLGGYVKISGMSPAEDLPDEVRTRAYYSQPVWKRIVVIAAGPFVNIVIAFVVLLIFWGAIGAPEQNTKVGSTL